MAVMTPVRERRPCTGGLRLLPVTVALLVLLLCAAGCTGSGNGAPPSGVPPGSPLSTAPAGLSASPAAGGPSIILDLTARNMTFDTAAMTVPAGAGVTINFHNREPAGSSQVTGIAHNFAVYTGPAATEEIFRGDIITGGTDAVYRFTAPSSPGTYFFRCDVHPGAMHGQFIVR